MHITPHELSWRAETIQGEMIILIGYTDRKEIISEPYDYEVLTNFERDKLSITLYTENQLYYVDKQST